MLKLSLRFGFYLAVTELCILINCNYCHLENIASNKMDIIYPATEKHILKFSSQPMYLVHETDDIYQTLTLPHILDSSLSLQVS